MFGSDWLQIAAVLLSSKGRSASVAVDDSSPAPFASSGVVNRSFRSVSNQIEEDAVNGLLVDLLTPMAEERRARVQPVQEDGGDKRQDPAPLAAEPPCPEPASKVEQDDSDSGVSDSSDSEKEESFFPDNLASPKLGRSSGRSGTSAAALLRQLKPPPATLQPQESVLSWRDYLRAECPVCQELSENGGGKDSSVCAPCGAFVCKSCVLVFKQKDQKLFVRVCRRCRSKVPADGEMVCGACCVVVLGPGEETRTCTECNRSTCFNCCRLYTLKSLGESEPRAVCIACVSEVQTKLSAYPRNLNLSAVASQQQSPPAQPPDLERKSSGGSFWKSLKSPRRTSDHQLSGSPSSSSLSSTSSSPRRPGLGGKKTTTPRKSLGARDSAPFPGVKLHTQVVGRTSGTASDVPESIAVRKQSRPPPITKVTFGSDSSLPPAAPARVGLVMVDVEGDVAAGKLGLQRGQYVRWIEDRGNGWAFGCLEVNGQEKRGLFRSDCVSYDQPSVASVGSEDSAAAKYPVGSLVRAMVGLYWTECEVTREGSAQLPYEVRTLDASKTVIQVGESDLMPPLRPALDAVDPQQRKTPREETGAIQKVVEPDEAAVLDSLKNRVMQMQLQRVGSASSSEKLLNASGNVSVSSPSLLSPVDSVVELVTSPEASRIEGSFVEEESERSVLHRLGKSLIAAVRENNVGQVLKVGCLIANARTLTFCFGLDVG